MMKQNKKTITSQIDDLIKKGYTRYTNKNLEGALRLLNEALKISKKKSYQLGIAFSKQYLACIYFQKNHLSEGKKCLDEAMKIFEKEKKYTYAGNAMREVASLDVFRYDLASKTELLGIAYQYYKKANNKNQAIMTLVEMGKIFWLHGNAESAIVTFAEAMQTSETLKHPRVGKELILPWMIIINLAKGYLDDAKKLVTELLGLDEPRPEIKAIGEILHALVHVTSENNLTKYLSKIESNLHYLFDEKIDRYLSMEIIFLYMNELLNNEKSLLARKLMTIVEKNYSRESDLFFRHKIYFLQGKLNLTLLNLSVARDYFEYSYQIIKKLEIELADAQVNRELALLNFREYQITKKQDSWDTCMIHLNEALHYFIQKEFIRDALSTLLLQEYMYEFFDYLEPAINVLEELVQFCKTYNLDEIIPTLTSKIADLTKKKNTLEALKQQDLSEKTLEELDDLLHIVDSELVIDEPPEIVKTASTSESELNTTINTYYGIIVLDLEKGHPAYSYYLSERFNADTVLISGLLSAISNFSSEIMNKESSLKTINYEGFTIIIEQGNQYAAVLVSDNETLDSRKKLRYFIYEFEEKFAPRVAEVTYSPGDVIELDLMVRSLFGTLNVEESPLEND